MKPASFNFPHLDALEDFLAAMARVPGELPGLSELDHALQCAHLIKIMAPTDEALQIAGLVHDIGQAIGHAKDHEYVAAKAILPLLGPRIAELVRLHVEAKRYLFATEPGYDISLSKISSAGLSFQGGAMNAAEIASFDDNPHSRDAICLRRCDDGAKIAGLIVPGLSVWLPILRRVAAAPSL